MDGNSEGIFVRQKDILPHKKQREFWILNNEIEGN
jgi:hypothetical protein